MNSLKLWLTLQVHGRQAYEELIDRQLKLAVFFADCVRTSELFELAVPQVLPIVNFRLKRAGIAEEERRAAQEAIVHEVTRDGRRWISTTLVNGQSVIRMMVISYLTGHGHLEDLMIAVTEALPQQPIAGLYVVEPEGTVNLGFTYGSVQLVDKTLEEAKAAIEADNFNDLTPLREQFQKLRELIILDVQRLAHGDSNLQRQQR